MAEIATGSLNFSEKLARVPFAPAPVFPYSAKVTFSVLGVEVDHSVQPAELTTLVMEVFWKSTRAYWDQGRPI
jgi:hypothetical protein